MVRKLLIVAILLASWRSSVALKCFNCNSTENFDCHVATSKLDKRNYTCEVSDEGTCFSQNINGIAKRWCSEDLPMKPAKYCNGMDYCNTPKMNFACISCDSTTNPNCKTNTSLVTTTCESTACFSDIDSTGKITRGCANCTSNPSLCTSCQNSIKCNNQIFQTCYDCSGENCIETSPSTKITQCNANSICFTKFNTARSVERGCTTENFECESGSCATCTGDKCNKAVFPANRLSCLQCSGSAECNEGSVSGKYCSNYMDNDQCFTYADENNQIVRGCLSDDDLHNCTSSNCETCNTINCNTIKERPSKLKCFQCQDCNEIEQDKLQASTCKGYPFNAEEKCFTLVDGTTKAVERGCFYDTVNITSKCDGSLCENCTEDGCNGKNVTSCYSCIDCLATNASTPLTQCAPGDFCISEINEQNQVIRGCSDKKCASVEDTCKECYEEECNGKIFPNDRQSCLQCDSLSENDDCANGIISSTLCKIYKKGDQCYSYVDTNNLIHRGCSSDTDEKRKNCTHENHCEECVGVSCNKKALYKEPTQSCVQCVNCTNDLPDVKRCEKRVLYFKQEECYTQNLTVNNVTTNNRGCLLDLEDPSSCENCYRCINKGCNKYGEDYKEFPDFRCVVCNGENCATTGLCDPIPTTENEGKGCFVGRREDDLIIRDCLTTLKRWNATSNIKYVTTCLTDSCNTMAAPGSAVSIQVTSGLLFALTALVFSLNNII